MVYQYIVAAIAGYLIGNIQFAVIFSKLLYKDDVRRHGSGNAGTTNMMRVFGLKPGLLTFVGDFLKGIAGVLLGRLIGGEVGAYFCALFVVIGHDFPVFLKFKGGKGVASSFGILWCLNPLLGAVITVLAAALLYLTRTVAIASIVCCFVYFVLSVIFFSEHMIFVFLAAMLFALILIRHTENIKRIIKGEESKLFERKKHTSAQ